MDIGIIGLGRMGGGVTTRLLKAGHRVVAYNRSPEKTEAFREQGAEAAHTLEELVAALPAPRTVWLYLPAGQANQEHIESLAALLEPGDTVLDGSNSMYQDTLARAAYLAERSIALLDVGTSGGIRGREDGYCLMIGGAADAYERHLPVWESVAQAGGHRLVGPVGSGHYVKMVHNAIEYGMMQAYGEGIDLLAKSQFAENLDLAGITDLWEHGSIIRSFLGSLLHEAIAEDASLSAVTSRIQDNGEGRWAVEEALRNDVSVPVMAASLFVRYQSRDERGLAARVVSVLRNKFGGHAASKE